jgi:hypothetical protein
MSVEWPVRPIMPECLFGHLFSMRLFYRCSSPHKLEHFSPSAGRASRVRAPSARPSRRDCRGLTVSSCARPSAFHRTPRERFPARRYLPARQPFSALPHPRRDVFAGVSLEAAVPDSVGPPPVRAVHLNVSIRARFDAPPPRALNFARSRDSRRGGEHEGEGESAGHAD